MSKYQEIDDLIHLCISEGTNTFGQLWRGRPGRRAKELGMTEVDRVVDRRLQALRKKGVIAYDPFDQTWSFT